MARNYSEDEASRDRGGDLGYVSKGALPEEIEERIFAMEEGEVSPVVELEGKFFIFKVEERRKAESREFEQAKEQIKKRIEYDKRKERWKGYVEGLREGAEIEVRE
jgi:foldase protein PrsA